MPAAPRTAAGHRLKPLPSATHRLQARPRPATPRHKSGKSRCPARGAETPRSQGYVRVSTSSQVPDRQLKQLESECDEVSIEIAPGAARSRPVFDDVIASLKAGDCLVVLDLDRAFRSSIDAILTANILRERSVGFRILSLDVDTRTPEGEMFYGLVAVLAQYERRIISRRTREGLAAARGRGVRLGRPTRLQTDVIRDAHAWIAETGLPSRYVAALLGVSRITLQRGFRRVGLVNPTARRSADHSQARHVITVR
ncbi:MAG: recombinase family protein [Pseudomonadota bacterium]